MSFIEEKNSEFKSHKIICRAYLLRTKIQKSILKINYPMDGC